MASTVLVVNWRNISITLIDATTGVLSASCHQSRFPGPEMFSGTNPKVKNVGFYFAAMVTMFSFTVAR